MCRDVKSQRKHLEILCTLKWWIYFHSCFRYINYNMVTSWVRHITMVFVMSKNYILILNLVKCSGTLTPWSKLGLAILQDSWIRCISVVDVDQMYIHVHMTTALLRLLLTWKYLAACNKFFSGAQPCQYWMIFHRDCLLMTEAETVFKTEIYFIPTCLIAWEDFIIVSCHECLKILSCSFSYTTLHTIACQDPQS
jgi:hypothetical protein